MIDSQPIKISTKKKQCQLEQQTNWKFSISQIK